jgi:hypothetical protein
MKVYENHEKSLPNFLQPDFIFIRTSWFPPTGSNFQCAHEEDIAPSLPVSFCIGLTQPSKATINACHSSANTETTMVLQ